MLSTVPAGRPHVYQNVYPQQRQPYRRPAAPARPTAAPARQPTARGQSPQPKPSAPTAPKPKPEPIVMPSPEQLGVRLDAPAPTRTQAKTQEDWLPLLRRLDAHGMTRFEFAPHADGYRFACELPGSGRVEVVGAGKVDVLRKALTEVESGLPQ